MSPQTSGSRVLKTASALYLGFAGESVKHFPSFQSLRQQHKLCHGPQVSHWPLVDQACSSVRYILYGMNYCRVPFHRHRTLNFENISLLNSTELFLLYKVFSYVFI
jgi:hypothetical protein